MPINFHIAKNRNSYTDRVADTLWKRFIGNLVEVEGKEIADIGCGGGIYSIAFAEMGAAHVIGVDFSREILSAAREYCQEYPSITFQQGSALESGLPANSIDIILERALTHHLKAEELPDCFAEALRVLRPDGTLLVQNRTPEDCRLAGSVTNPRGYFFECFPRLLDIEVGRRQDSATIQNALREGGFTQIQEHHLLEYKETFDNFTALAETIRTRKGRSILHELSDGELETLISYMSERYRDHQGPIEEKCWWTVWSAQK